VVAVPHWFGAGHSPHWSACGTPLRPAPLVRLQRHGCREHRGVRVLRRAVGTSPIAQPHGCSPRTEGAPHGRSAGRICAGEACCGARTDCLACGTSQRASASARVHRDSGSAGATALEHPRRTALRRSHANAHLLGVSDLPLLLDPRVGGPSPLCPFAGVRPPPGFPLPASGIGCTPRNAPDGARHHPAALETLAGADPRPRPCVLVGATPVLGQLLGGVCGGTAATGGVAQRPYCAGIRTPVASPP